MKVRTDDFLAAGHTLDDLVRLSSGEPPEAPSTSVGESLPLDQRSIRQHPPALARERDILERLSRELRTVGHVGEERAAKLLYLVATSRLLDKIVSAVVKGPSAGGKSAVVERVLAFFPDEAYYSLSGMSERALAYSEEPLRHRLLVVFEAAGLTGDWASYLMRSLLSEGCIRYEVAEATSEGVKVRLIEREGPTGLIVTTTAVRLHAENETRHYMHAELGLSPRVIAEQMGWHLACTLRLLETYGYGDIGALEEVDRAFTGTVTPLRLVESDATQTQDGA